MPCLLISGGSLVKSVQFRDLTHIGDPLNAVRIFNEKEVDELILYDIHATSKKRGIDFYSLEKIVNECFMPVCYGGGVDNLEDMRRLFELGIEKVSLSSALFSHPDLVKCAAAEFGSQSVVGTLDIKNNFFGKTTIRTKNGQQDTGVSPLEFVRVLEQSGVGEIILHSIDHDGMWSGMNIGVLKKIGDCCQVPLILAGGAGNMNHIRDAIKIGGASGVAIGSMAVFQAKGLGVLIRFPTREQQVKALEDQE
jgi:imidazole glycerol-phosphate synthase subunit HisF